MPAAAKKTPPTEASEAKYFMLGKQLPGDAKLLGIPGDVGVLIDSAKFTMMVPKDRFERLTRLYGLSPYSGTKKWDCGECGLRFADESFRDKHGTRRHGAGPRYLMKDLDECSEEEKEQILAELGPRSGINRKTDPGYYTNPGDFHVPDPSASEENRVDRELANSIEWENTTASRK